jgi:hypothetical protein
MIKNKSENTGATVNLKEQNALHSFRITFRDTKQFYAVVNWLNENVGKGRSKWTMSGRQVLFYLRKGETRTVTVYIYSDNFSDSDATALSLM